MRYDNHITLYYKPLRSPDRLSTQPAEQSIDLKVGVHADQPKKTMTDTGDDTHLNVEFVCMSRLLPLCVRYTSLVYNGIKYRVDNMSIGKQRTVIRIA